MRIKTALMRAGATMGTRLVRNVERASSCLVIGDWMKRYGVRPGNCQTREDVWRAVAERIGMRPVLYLEFGIFEGEATQWWSAHLKHPECVLHGFDSFEGLPEEWRKDRPKGMFDVDGRIPRIADSRVRFFKGWFNETLPGYDLPRHDQLFVNIDADLYSSSKYVLDFLKPHLKPGVVIYFDEFSDRDHEFRAFSEFLDGTDLKIQVIASDDVLYSVAFELC